MASDISYARPETPPMLELDPEWWHHYMEGQLKREARKLLEAAISLSEEDVAALVAADMAGENNLLLYGLLVQTFGWAHHDAMSKRAQLCVKQEVNTNEERGGEA